MSRAKERNWVVPLMRANTKAVAYTDRKKEQARRACREEVEWDEEEDQCGDGSSNGGEKNQDSN